MLISKAFHKIKKYLLKNYPRIITRYGFFKKRIYLENIIQDSLLILKEKDQFKEINNKTSPIFIFWWDGFDNAPEIITLCLKRLKKMKGLHPLILINKNNIEFYCKNDLNHSLELLRNKVIQIQYFSDILRTYLISKYGGTWLDATIYLLKPIDDIIDNRFFFSYRIKNQKYYNPADGLWLGFFFSSSKNNSLLKFINNGLIEIIKKTGRVQDYYTIDYLFKIAYLKSHSIRNYILKLPYVNEDIIKFSNLNKSISIEDFKVIKNLPFLKLNWREQISSDFDSKQNLYSMLLQSKL